jgi:hypothetical protein
VPRHPVVVLLRLRFSPCLIVWQSLPSIVDRSP